MYVSFNLLPPNAKVWIYQSDSNLSSTDVELIEKEVKFFLNNWSSHNKEIESSYEIRYNRFLIIGLNENINSASGCSIDKSVNFIKNLQSILKVNFLNRLDVAYKIGNEINSISLLEFQKMIRENKLSKDSIVYNNMIDTKKLYLNSWETTIENSWHKKFL
ncbi:MAG: ABC transporter ATPase [Flavobacteriaceae bacterium]|nr:ABC transporter ATPase [Flavobacteriaceae bacterium]|tara:strand:- start:15224 stop:15706 length:483 start_codon:yes stop_codon:yes gene_type:complete